jgi:hypothetical protein
MFEDELQIVFKDLVTKDIFMISRALRANVGSRKDHDILKGKGRFRFKRRGPYKKNTQPFDPDLRPTVWTETTWIRKMPQFYTPKEIVELTSKAFRKPEQTKKAIQQILPPKLALETYTKYFSTLLHFEEEEKRYAIFDLNPPSFQLMIIWIECSSTRVLYAMFRSNQHILVMSE